MKSLWIAVGIVMASHGLTTQALARAITIAVPWESCCAKLKPAVSDREQPAGEANHRSKSDEENNLRKNSWLHGVNHIPASSEPHSGAGSIGLDEG